tara:strand:+ start:2964 stop:3740 length:777 start_codon:yes stop_codon:yes gene_type:complete
MLSGCTLPAYKLLQDAGLSYQVVNSNNFKHLLVTNSHHDTNQSVIVFIEGDGRPWQQYNRIAFEPTPDKPLLLEWFLATDYSSIYLGRPCYFDLNDQHCSPYWYTHGRYSEPVVESLVQILQKIFTDTKLVLVGHSGGGTLAVLIAEKMNNVDAVVTIAGNLQVNTWSNYHHYSPLQGSMDPMLRKGLAENIQQVHFYSPFDTVIQAQWIKEYSAKQLNSRVIELPVHGHDYAWKEFYPMFHKVLFEMNSHKTGAIID